MPVRIEGLEFRFKVAGLGFRVQGFWSRVQGLGVWCSGFSAYGLQLHQHGDTEGKGLLKNLDSRSYPIQRGLVPFHLCGEVEKAERVILCSAEEPLPTTCMIRMPVAFLCRCRTLDVACLASGIQKQAEHAHDLGIL